MKGFKFEIGTAVLLKDRRGTVAKVVDRFEGDPAIYILETLGTCKKYELTEDDIGDEIPFFE